jgi:hypothetical protein
MRGWTVQRPARAREQPVEIVGRRRDSRLLMRMDLCATASEEGKGSLPALFDLRMSKSVAVTGRGRIDEHQKALRAGFRIQTLCASVLRADVNRGRGRQAVCPEYVVELGLVVAGEEDVVAQEREFAGPGQ